MKTPWKLTRYLPLAARFLREGRLPELLRALADKRTPQGQRFAALKEDLQLLRALSLAWFKGEYRQISSQALLMVVAALLYFLTPLDAVPDWLVGVGFVDDLAVLAGTANVGTVTAAVADTVQLDDININSFGASQLAMKAIDSAINSINSSRADLGALQSRFENAVANINIAGENISAARGRIVDADFAKETSSLSRAQILQQAGTAMVAQANQAPQGVLSLLR